MSKRLFLCLVVCLGMVFLSAGVNKVPDGKKNTPANEPIVSLNYATYLGGSSNDGYCKLAVDNSGRIHVTGRNYSSDFPTLNAYQSSRSSSALEAYASKFEPGGSALVYSTYFGGTSSEYFSSIAVASNGDLYIAGDTFSSGLPAYNSYSGSKDGFVARFDANGNFLNGRYLGTASEDRILAITVDSSNNVFIVGRTYNSAFPTQNPYQSVMTGPYCGFISKLDPTLATLEYSTFLGGSGGEVPQGIVVDDSGYFYVAGCTGSSDFPIKNAWQDTYAGGEFDTFVTKFLPDGSDIVFSTFLGGSGRDYAYGLHVDGAGIVSVAGMTYSTDFPTLAPFQGTNGGGEDMFVSRLSADGSQLIYSTYLGGVGDERFGSLALDGRGNMYVSGSTFSADFPTQCAYQPAKSALNDAFLSILSPDGSELLFSTFFGGNGYDYCNNIVVDSTGKVYIAGSTTSTDLPVINGFQDVNAGGEDIFAAMFSQAWGLTVDSTPEGGVPITVSPPDNNGNGDGVTQLSRVYDAGTTVSLTAPESFNTRNFSKWTLDGSDYFSRDLQVTMDGNHTATAVYQVPGEIVLNRTQLNFAGTSQGLTTVTQYFSITNGGEVPLDWTIDKDALWLICSPTGGTNAGQISVSVNVSTLYAGTYNGTITVSAPGAGNSPQKVNVTLTIYNAGASGSPFGYFETPDSNCSVYGSVPVTGWALDDIEVVAVKIYREEGSNLVYIGDAVFVEGARPDVELAYPGYPWCYRAGWGYMMLTNFLPDNGNGTFTFHAIAEDREGNHVTLGTKTITCDNANAVRPFGAIDTPTQGGTASGTGFRNHGWVLTPPPNKVPENGSTINVYVDGVTLGHPVYNNYRSDVAGLFPGYLNSNGAGAYFDFDTTAYDNGVHTIMWTALDDDGNVDGIGSRYFTINNIGIPELGLGIKKQGLGSREQGLDNAPLAFAAVAVKKGFNKNVEPAACYPGENGKITIDLRELERLELQLTPNAQHLTQLTGYHVIGEQLKPLPIGSTLDSERGIFYWVPGPGFLGTFQLLFVEAGPNGELNKWLVEVKIIPKFYR